MSNDRVDTNRPEYSWIPFFEELARRLHEDGWRHRQPDIVAELQRMRSEGMRISSWVDNRLTEWIDPFSLIGTMRRGITFNNMQRIMASFKLFFGVSANLPIESPINPKVDNRKSFFFTGGGEDDQTEAHWDLLERVLSPDSPRDDAELAELLNRSVDITEVNHAKLSGALHWIDPHRFLKTDTIAYFMGAGDYSDFGRNYLENLNRLGENNPRLFPALNVEERLSRGISDTSNIWSMNAGTGNFARAWWLKDSYVAVDWDVRTDLGLCSTEDEVRSAVAQFTRSEDAMKQIVDFRLAMRRDDVILIKAEEAGWHHVGICCSNTTYLAKLVDGGDPHLIRKGVIWYPKLIKTADLSLPGPKALQRVVTNRDDVLLRIKVAVQGTSPDEPMQDVSTDRSYSVDTMIGEGVFLERSELERIMAQLERKQNLILQGPPGTGKTFLAKRLAYALMGERADERIASVQFHQSFDYEDFVGGYRPGLNDADQLVFRARDGAFLELCERARYDADRRYVMLIDETNRGNLSKVFGELFMLIEADKRSERHAVELPHRVDMARNGATDAERFFVPPNVYIIGTMNLADRSLTGMNVAMRRRFGFVDLKPQFGEKRFSDWLKTSRFLGDEKMPVAMQREIHRRMLGLNRRIATDPSLSKQYAVGHSFFCPDASHDPRDKDWDEWYRTVIDYEIRPLLDEYWFDDPGKAEREADALVNGMPFRHIDDADTLDVESDETG